MFDSRILQGYDSIDVVLLSEFPMFNFISLDCKRICWIQGYYVGGQGQTDTGSMFCANKGG